nr:PAS-domain containing protein [uncultured Dongia sp.]
MPRFSWPAPFMITGRPIPYGLVMLLGALGYFALARLGLAFTTPQASASSIWPASGFALALLIVHGGRVWPAIAAAAFLSNALNGGVVTAIPITFGNTIEALLGLWLFQYLAALRPEQFPIARSAAIAAAALLAPIASAVFGVTTLAASDRMGLTSLTDVIITWWAGDVLGILLLAPLLLALTATRPTKAPAAAPLLATQLLRSVVILVATILAAALAFLQPGWGAAIFLALPTILFAARWFGFLGSAAIVLVTAALWFSGTAAGMGPFVEGALNTSLINMQIMLGALALSALVLAEISGPRLAAADLVFLAGSLITCLIYLAVTNSHAKIDARHFNNLVTRISDHTVDRMSFYVSTLQGGASLYAASREVGRTEWHDYVRSLDLFARHPGINGVGVIVPADVTARAAFIAAARRDGAPDFDIRPVPGATDGGYSQHFVVLYSEPQPDNKAAIGLDIATEPGRRATAIAARDSGRPMITAQIKLAQTNSAGFLLFVPMYREPLETLTPASLRWSFHGWVYAVFSADAFFSHSMPIESAELRLQVYDGAQPQPKDLMFDSGAGSQQTSHFTAEAETELALYGRTFTLRWQRTSGFFAQSRQVPILFSAGLILFCTLLAALIATLMSQKERATTIALNMNAALTASNERFELAVACSRDGIWDYDLVTDQVWASPRYRGMYGYDDDDNGPADHWEFWASVILPEDLLKSRRQYDEMIAGEREGLDLIQRYRHKQGHIVHVHNRALAVRNADGAVTRVIGVHTDISLVVRLQQQFQDAISVMADGFGLFDADDRLILFNEGFIDEGTRKAIGDPTGCTFEEVVRAFVEHDMPDAKSSTFDRESWIAQRMERHRNPPKEPIEVKWGGERWMRISERRTADGGYVGIWSDVTEIKRLGQRLGDAISALPDGFALFDKDDRLVVCNDSFVTPTVRQILGNPVGQRYEDIYRLYADLDLGMADVAARESWVAARVHKHQNPADAPYEVTTRAGQIFRVLERRTTEGGIVGTWTDVSAERIAKRQLHDAISVLADGFALFDAEDRLVVCNDAYMHSPSLRDMGSLVGVTMETILRRIAYAEVTDIRAKENPEAWIADRLSRHLNPTVEPYELLLTDGRVIHISERRTSDGGVVGIWSNVTELRVAERRLQDAIASINEGFVLLDAEGRFALFNDEFLRLYPKSAPYVAVGGTMEHALRQGALAGEYPDLSDPADIEAFVQEWVARYRDPAAFQGEGAFADGRWALIGHRGTADGGCVNVYTDITAMKARESDLADAKSRVEEQATALTLLAEDLETAKVAAESANHSKSHFLANMSHELRTPLNGILGFAEIIRAEVFGKIEPAKYRDYADDIHSSGKHLLTLINNLLDLSKIEADRMTLNIDAIETSTIVAQALRLVEKLAAERHIELAEPDIAGCPVMHADQTQAQQILLNLLSNAVKFTPDNGRVVLRIVEDGEAGIVISIADNGIGMTPAEVTTAMERFGQAAVSYSRTTSGTGLGLPLVEGLVRLHGGSLAIESEKGVGTTVSVRLPWHAGLYRRAASVSAA